MGTLTGQQIKDTYDGLLKLADSTTGITQTYQAIQDGLGNDTGLQIKENAFYSNNFSADTYNGLFEYPGRWTNPTFSADTIGAQGNTGFTGFFYGSTATLVAVAPQGLSTASDSNTYPVFFWLYKGELFRGVSFFVNTADTVNAKVAIYEATTPSNAWNVGTQVFRPGRKVLDAGEFSCSTTGIKFLSFSTPWVVPYTGLYYVMIKVQTSSALRLGGGAGVQLPASRFSANQPVFTYRVDLTPVTVNTLQPYAQAFWANTNYAAAFPDTFDYTTGASNWTAQGLHAGLFWQNQFNKI